MSNELKPQPASSPLIVYQIKVEGHLDRQWADWFGGLSITPVEDGHTLLTGPVLDQAALHGLIKKVRDLGMALISVNRVEAGQAGVMNIKVETIANKPYPK